MIIAVAYLLCEFNDTACFDRVRRFELCTKVFGCEPVELAIKRMREACAIWRVLPQTVRRLRPLLCMALLINRSPRLDDLTVTVLENLRQRESSQESKLSVVTLSRILVNLGIIINPLEPLNAGSRARFKALQPDEWLESPEVLNGISPEWAGWCQRWRRTTTLARRTRRNYYYRRSVGESAFRTAASCGPQNRRVGSLPIL